MKKFFLFVSAFLMSAFAFAQTTVSAGYENSRYKSFGDNSHYAAIGVIQSTSVGSFDAYLQGSRFGSDRAAGVEVGYGKATDLKVVSNFTRLAIGTMGNIDGVGRANYALLSTEFSKPINDRFSGYVGLSHTFGLNDQALSNNRVQFGVDTVLDKNTSLRVGLSSIRQGKETLNGAVVYLNRSL